MPGSAIPGRNRVVAGYPSHLYQKFFQKGEWPGSRGPLNFSALNANAW